MEQATTRTKTHHYCSAGWTLTNGQPVHIGECLNDGTIKCYIETLTAIAKKTYKSKGQELVTWQGDYRVTTWETIGSVTL